MSTECKYGECFEQGKCNCEPKNRRHTHSSEYCPINIKCTCELKECKNYRTCGNKEPYIILDCHEQMCPNCAVMMYTSNATHTGETTNCLNCAKETDVIKLICNHKFCVGCWNTIWVMKKTVKKNKSLCPLCKN